ncbi:MAG: protein-disulfide reductase [Betaproteobacteria bacterium]|jgi:thiol:disulfide interchange protein DsbD|nr:protein-disulfide reductase [Betaproteobacteria bacterium]
MHMLVIRLLFWLVIVSSGAGIAWAQLMVSAKSAVVSTPQVRAELVAHAPDGVQTGKTFWLGLQLQHAREWHTYWRNPGDSGLPTQLEFILPPGLEVGPVIWPLPKKLSAGTLTNYGFDGDALLAVAVKVTSAYRAPSNGQLPVQLHANWLVCRLECIPQEGDFALQLPTQSSFANHAKAFTSLIEQQATQLATPQKAARFDGDFLVAAVEGLPAAWVGQKLSIFPTEPELLESSTDQHALAEQSWQGSTWSVRLPVSTARNDSPTKLGWLLVSQVTGESRQGVELVLPVSGAWPSPTVKAYAEVSASKLASTATPSANIDGAFGFILALAGALLGGLILNAMPCVLPILAIKVLGFAQHGASKHLRRLTGVAYTVGVVASFLALGSAVLVLRTMGEQLGWGFQLQTPAVVAALAVLFTLIALNLWDVFSLGNVLPTNLASLQSRHPVVDALLSGVLAVAVASPCTAPFMGASLGVAMTMPTWQALSVFACMGLGLAMPFLLASWVPAVAQALPKPGMWMVNLRHALAFPMLATVIWLLWVFGLQTSVTQVMLLLGGLLVVALTVWACRFRTALARAIQVSGLLAIVWIGLEVLASPSATPQTQAPSTTVRTATQASGDLWQHWTATAVQTELAQGHAVFVDFTAAWCVTCQINKQTTLNQPELLADFAAKQVRLMRADWTRRDPAISRALAELGRSGVPVYVLYAPNRAPQVLSELLSVAQVRQALEQLQPKPANN